MIRVGPCLRRTLVVVLVLASAGWGAPEVIHLKDGHQVTGEVIAEKPNAIFVDLGFDVLKIPREFVVSRTQPGVATPAQAVARGEDVDPSGFFESRSLKVAPVKELVQTYGEAVISIETPSAKGSGFIVNADGYAITNAHVIQGESRIAATDVQARHLGRRFHGLDAPARCSGIPKLCSVEAREHHRQHRTRPRSKCRSRARAWAIVDILRC